MERKKSYTNWTRERGDVPPAMMAAAREYRVGWRICKKRETINIPQPICPYPSHPPVRGRRKRSEQNMRCIVEAVIPAEAGNRSIMDGTLPSKMKKYLDDVKPEAVYFTVKDGQRTIFVVVNLPSEDKMVAFHEPLWLDWGAAVTVTPAMSLADLEKAGKDMEKLAKERK
jgi:hypothetical protein